MMPAYTFNSTREFGQVLDTFDTTIQRRALNLLPDIGHNPDAGAPLRADLRPYWDAHIGDYRIIYLVDRRARHVTFVYFGHRKNVYDKLRRLRPGLAR